MAQHTVVIYIRILALKFHSVGQMCAFPAMNFLWTGYTSKLWQRKLRRKTCIVTLTYHQIQMRMTPPTGQLNGKSSCGEYNSIKHSIGIPIAWLASPSFLSTNSRNPHGNIHLCLANSMSAVRLTTCGRCVLSFITLIIFLCGSKWCLWAYLAVLFCHSMTHTHNPTLPVEMHCFH